MVVVGLIINWILWIFPLILFARMISVLGPGARP